MEKKMRNVRLATCLAVVVCMMAVANFSSAEIIRGISIDFVAIGNAGNAADTRTGLDSDGRPLASPYGCGAVSSSYRIGKYEVTNAQWNTFISLAGAPTGNDIVYGQGYCYGSYWTGVQQPANRVSWYEAAQFCNYLTSGNKSKGAYQFSGDNTNPGDFLGIDRVSSISTYGTTYVIPTEDEWYKAAYFKPDGSGYSLYANGTDTAPIAGVESNYNGAVGVPWDIDTGTMEQNGTFDMMGNVWEWNETQVKLQYDSRGARGGACNGDYHEFGAGYDLSSSYWGDLSPYYEGFDNLSVVGFRVAVIPEPATLFLLTLGSFILRRKNTNN